ncbi:DUF4253 domain-containing protein [Solirubrobacter phytolaccae]|uniref:DUF4253 domain-containing protein n=1 Tax=Solirubrobacter phytolaccae TaxID=1404360 RepID=A0A9X3SA08_9ACTN|nr:DUF4253 domain-containing protein [Solirubrobacter phytolaccae]MDA0182091.1 DUF4253 domain-containing protein [Solirubrobacter phytolaccae]
MLLTVAVVAFAGLAIMLDRRDDELYPRDCAALRAAVEQLPRDFPEEGRRRLSEEVCRGWHRVPEVPTPSPVAQPGCAEPGEPVEPVTRRTVRPPTREGPFLARVRGTLPETGKPIVAGVQLPQGSKCEAYWATDLPAKDAIDLARRLAAKFPDTGLWPVLWNWADEGPDNYYTPGNPARADDIDVEADLRERAKAWQVRLDRLARGVALDAAFDPFGRLADHSDDGPSPRVLVLVPVHRPADALTVTGFTWSEIHPPSMITAVMRSWEDRYGAMLVEVGPGIATLAPAGRPRGAEARRLEAELSLVAPDEEASLPSDPLWFFGWPD